MIWKGEKKNKNFMIVRYDTIETSVFNLDLCVRSVFKICIEINWNRLQRITILLFELSKQRFVSCHILLSWNFCFFSLLFISYHEIFNFLSPSIFNYFSHSFFNFLFLIFFRWFPFQLKLRILLSWNYDFLSLLFLTFSYFLFSSSILFFYYFILSFH